MNALPLNISVGDNVLITTDNWFYAPDGRSYRAVFGRLKAVRTAEDTLGVKPNGRSTNWYVEVGDMLIAGCQVHYAVKTDTCSAEVVETSHVHDGKYVSSTRPSEIYMAVDA